MGDELNFSAGPRVQQVIAQTEHWLRDVVIGLQLCPFARRVEESARVHYVVSAAQSSAALLHDLQLAIAALVAADPQDIETTLLIHPQVLTEFLSYNAFLQRVDQLLEELDCVGVIQVASFHPQYEFAEHDPDDMAHYTNRSPFPMLHLLREDSIEQAIAGYPDPAQIYLRNIARLRKMTRREWQALNTWPTLTTPDPLTES